MNKLQNILNDIRGGENIELYIVILAAIVLLILDLFGYVNPEWMYSINVAILAIIATSLLGNRQRIDSLRDASYHTDKTFMNEFPDDFERKLLSSDEIWILGLTLGKTSIRYQHDLRRALLENRCRIKVILLDPYGLAIQLATKRGYDNLDIELQRSTVLRSIALFMDLYSVNPSNIEVRVIDYLPSFGCFGLNIDTPSGEIFLEHYGYKSLKGDVPRIHLTSNNIQWYETFRIQLHALWKDATPWNPNTP